MKDVIEQLTRAYPRLSPRMQRAATVVLNNPGDVAVDSMRAMAAKADVSPPTMLRLAQRMGFGNYEAFRDVFKRAVTQSGYTDRAVGLRERTGQTGVGGLIERTLGAMERGLASFRSPTFSQDIETIADVLIKARRAIVIANGASFGPAFTFQYVCRMSLPSLELATSPGLHGIDDLAFISEKDAVLVVATLPYAKSSIQAASFARERGAQVTAITDDRHSALGRIADSMAVASTESPNYFPSKTGMNIALEILSAVIAVRRGDDAIGDISAFEEALETGGYYWRESE